MNIQDSKSTPLPPFNLEVFLAEWEFASPFHMAASDIETLPLNQLLEKASPQEQKLWQSLQLGYTETWGMPKLRETIAQTYKNISLNNILCFSGAEEGLFALFHVLLSPHDHVIVPTPNYQSSETIPLSICQCSGIPMEYSPSSGWSLNTQHIIDAIKPNTKLIALNSPHNPTGFIIPENQLLDIISVARKHNISILSDEVYRGVEQNPSHTTTQIADLYEQGFSLNVMSKAYGLPGLRIGWIASQNTKILQKLEQFKHYLSICNSAPSEILALIALNNRHSIIKDNQKLIKDNLSLLKTLLAEFPELIQWHTPLGGCIAFPLYNGPDTTEEFCQKLREHSGILLLPPSVYQSQLNTLQPQHFRIGFGRGASFKEGIKAMHKHFNAFYPEFKA
jgi:hypothetical protein